MADAVYETIYRVIRRIPRGRVATYGQVAALAGRPRHARQVGYALSALGDDDTVPWHRVVNARGEISERSDPVFEEAQLARLAREGVVPDERGRISLDTYGWDPAWRRSY